MPADRSWTSHATSTRGRSRRCSYWARTRSINHPATSTSPSSTRCAAARARRHARRRDSGAQQLAPADGSCARGLERRSLAGRSCDHHPAARPAHVRQSLGARGTGRPDVGSTCGAAREIVRQTWASPLRDDKAWTSALKTGFVAMAASPAVPPAAAAVAAAQPANVSDGQVEIVFRPDPTIHDGSYANNGWLQELPKPLFKTTWENVVAISPALASRMAVKERRHCRSREQRPDHQGPCWVLPGQPDSVVTLFLGYGRTRAGRIGTGIGYDAYRLRSAASPWLAAGTIKATGATTLLATTQATTCSTPKARTSCAR